LDEVPEEFDEDLSHELDNIETTIRRVEKRRIKCPVLKSS
jgi:hypothetical protein